jgi:hypothetical protein
MKKVFPGASPGTDIFAQLNSGIKNDNHSHPQLEKRDASRLSKKTKQLNLWESPRKPAAEASPHLQIKSVAACERIDPKEIRYALWIYPHAVRACGGQYSADEAHKICKAVKGWDWVLDENNRPYCLPQLEALIDSIIKRSAGGEA